MEAGARFLGSLLLLLSFPCLAQQNKAIVLKSSLWRINDIPVCWENPSASSQALRDSVKVAVRKTWEESCGLRFVGWKECSEDSKGIRILIEDSGPHTKGLGTQINGVKNGMVLNFAFENWSLACRSDKEFCVKAIAVHEFGHAIGFAHEQNRTDCTFPNCLDQEQGTNGDWTVTSCDTMSIMNYCNPRWNNSGYLSILDRKAARYLYPIQSRGQSVKPFELVFNSTFALDEAISGKEQLVDSKVYVTGDRKLLGQVSKVVYQVQSSIDKETQKVTTSSNVGKFGIGLSSTSNFTVIAHLYDKEGKELKTLTKTLKPQEQARAINP